MDDPSNIFQFHKGTIKAKSGVVLFNIIPTFQFHKGTIKAIVPLVFQILAVFQFHKGTIKAAKALDLAQRAASFNSIKVQLRHSEEFPVNLDEVLSIP